MPMFGVSQRLLNRNHTKVCEFANGNGTNRGHQGSTAHTWRALAVRDGVPMATCTT